MSNLPRGFTWIGPPGLCTEEYVLSHLTTEDFEKAPLCKAVDNEQRLFTVGLFRIDIQEVQVQDLKDMRKVLPRPQYKLLKNRMCARLGRSRRK